jgi:3-hydroxyisobutyrate dehydrogenase-like beta-hydroxyacid dehydrogenase
MSSINKVAFIGLGAMGYPMAGHLKRSGLDVCVYNRTETKAFAWVDEYAGLSAPTPAEAAVDAQIVFLCVGNDSDVRSVTVEAEGVLSTMTAGTLLVDHTTTSKALAEELHEACDELGISFIDAPVSGGQAGAENGVLTVMAGGKESAFEVMEPVIAAYAKHKQRMGDVGSGQVTKMVNQLCIAGILGGLSEAFHFAECAGLDIDEVTLAIQGGAAQSWQMNNRAGTIAQRHYDFGFAIDWMRKDLGFALDVAEQMDLHLPIAKMVDDHYTDVQRNGGGRWDTSGLIEQIRMRREKVLAAKSAERVTHSGGCHCGSVRWTVEAPSVLATHTCNCSICDINHYQHLLVPESRFELTRGEEALSLYTFGSHEAKHYFCKHCGVKSFYVPRSNPDGVSVNARCLSMDTVEVIYDKPFDGKNWEKNAGSLAHLSKER